MNIYKINHFASSITVFIPLIFSPRTSVNNCFILPGTITYGLDIDGAIQKEMATAMKLQNANTLPIFLIADTFNRVVFVSQGYTIGLGEQLMKVIHKL